MRKIYLSGILLPIAITALSAQDLPDGAGKEVVKRMCNSCHGLEVVTGTRKTKERWQNTVDVMVSRGAVGTDDEIDLVINYLADHFGPAKTGEKKAPGPSNT